MLRFLPALALLVALLASGCSWAASFSAGAALSEDAAEGTRGAAAVHAHFEGGWTELFVTETLTLGLGADTRVRASGDWFHLTFGESLNLALELDQVGFYARLGSALVSYDDLDGAVWGGAFGPFGDFQVGIPLVREQETWLAGDGPLFPRRAVRRTLILTVGLGLDYIHRFDTDGAGVLTATVGLRWSHQQLR
jgi:hypothetical protein